ncbi:MAG: hypothetical protein ACQETO_07650 [Pseudomonadota bacterium]
MKSTHRERGSIIPLLLILLSVAAAVTIMLVLLDREPKVHGAATLDASALSRIEQLIVEQSPATLSRSGEQRIELTTTELNLLATFLLQSLPEVRDVAVQILPARPLSRIEASIPVGNGRARYYINVSADVRVDDQSVVLSQLQIGGLRLPEAITAWLPAALRDLAQRRGFGGAQLVELSDSVSRIEILDDGVAIHVTWQLDALPRLQQQARRSLMDGVTRESVLHYYGLAHDIGLQKESDHGLHQWLAQLFGSARRRSGQGGHDAIRENRSALLALALYVNRIDPHRLTGDASGSPYRDAAGTPPRLGGRRDLARHFLTSAAISASTGRAMADVIANSKELHDAKYGSGFNVADVAANRAGIRLGAESVANHASAMTIQRRLETVREDTLFMPDLRSDQALTDIPANTDNDSFRALAACLDERIDALWLYDGP